MHLGYSRFHSCVFVGGSLYCANRWVGLPGVTRLTQTVKTVNTRSRRGLQDNYTINTIATVYWLLSPAYTLVLPKGHCHSCAGFRSHFWSQTIYHTIYVNRTSIRNTKPNEDWTFWILQQLTNLFSTRDDKQYRLSIPELGLYRPVNVLAEWPG